MRHRLIVIEGPDGSGKTTLANHIKRATGFEYRHEGPPPGDRDPMVYYLGRLYDAYITRFTGTGGVILDRFAMGERVYGTILRETAFTDEQWRSFSNILQNAEALQIVCYPPEDRALGSWSERAMANKEFIKKAQVWQRTYTAFGEFAGDPEQNVFDYTVDDSDAVVHAIKTGELWRK
jgi:thymidylate kinase